MDDHDLTVLGTYLTAMDAELAKSALAAAGIAAIVRSDDCGGMRPHMQVGGVHLLVRAEDAEEAAALLETPADLPPASPDALSRGKDRLS